MARKLKPDWDGQGVLFAGGRSRRRKRNGRLGNAETALCNDCLEWCAEHPGMVAMAWRNNSGMAFLRNGGAMKLAPKGSPDIVGWLVNGIFLGIECKLPGQEVEEDSDQAECHALMARTNAAGLVVHSVEELATKVRRACGEGD